MCYKVITKKRNGNNFLKFETFKNAIAYLNSCDIKEFSIVKIKE